MTDVIVNEQLLLFGNVDVPMSNENTLKLLQVFGVKGYIPNVVQEVNMLDGRSTNRMSLTDGKTLSVNFNTNQIIMACNYNPQFPETRDFLQLAQELVEGLIPLFDLRVARCVLVKEKMMGDDNPDKIRAARLQLMVEDGAPEPIEWLLRRSIIDENGGETLLKLTEISRAQGFIHEDGNATAFDKVRFKSEVGTDLRNTVNRYTLGDILPLLQKFRDIQTDVFNSWERQYREA